MANSVWSSKTPRTIWSSREDSDNERAIATHACSLNIAEPDACRRGRACLMLLRRLFTVPDAMSDGNPPALYALLGALCRDRA